MIGDTDKQECCKSVSERSIITLLCSIVLSAILIITLNVTREGTRGGSSIKTTTTAISYNADDIHRVDTIHQLLEDYKFQHSMSTLQAEASQSQSLLCERKFVFIDSISCSSIGNQLGGNLHGLVLAVLLNRTVVAKDINCQGLLQFQSWVPTVAKLSQSDFFSNCTYEQTPQFKANAPGSTASKEQYACSLDAMTAPVLVSKALQNRAFDSFNSLSGVRFVFNTTMQRRDILFSCPVYENARFEIYGFLMSTFLDVSPLVMEYIGSTSNDLLNYSGILDPSIKNDTIQYHDKNLIIGLHARHQKINSNNSIFDASFESAIKTILSKEMVSATSDSRFEKCSVLIATDRPETLNRLSDFSRRVGCGVFFVKKTECARGFNDNVMDPLHHCADGPEHEHGPWAGPLSTLSDLVFVGKHAQYFIGSIASTYSQLIADMVAENNAKRALGSDNIWWVQPQNSGKYYNNLVNFNKCDMTIKRRNMLR